MPRQKPRVRPCKRLDALSLSALEEILLRSFFVLGTKELHTNTGLLGYLDNREAISHLFERKHVMLLEELKAYLIPRLPKYYHQKIIDDMITYLSKPPFNTEVLMSCTDREYYKLYGDIEWNFDVLGKIVSSSDMSEIIPCMLKCLIYFHVTKLDLSDIQKFGKCWFARCRRTLFSWGMIKGSETGNCIDFSRDILLTYGVEFHWKSLILNHLSSISSGLLKVSPLLSGLTKINVNHLATGELIWSIGCNCRNLEELHMYIPAGDRAKYTTLFEQNLIYGITSLFGHESYTKTAFRGWPLGCPKLKILSLPVVEDEKSLDKVAGKLLRYLPHLEELNNAEISGPLSCLLEDDNYKQAPLALTKIEQGIYDGHGLEEVCNCFHVNIKNCLPNVRSAILSYSKREDSLRMLSNFPKLDTLDVKDDEGKELEFVPHFKNLVYLKNNCRWDEKRLAGFSQRAPCIERFELVYGSLNKHKKSRESISFPKMKHLEIVNPRNIETDLLISLVKSSKMITHLHLVDVPYNNSENVLLEIMDDKVAAIIAPSLKKLQIFEARISSFNRNCFFLLSEAGFNSFLYNCPDLIEIGNLYHWYIPYDRISELRKMAKENNWNVNLLPHDEI